VSVSAEPQKSMEEVIRSDGRYPVAAYAFLHECLAQAVQDAHGENLGNGKQHVTGQAICHAMRQLAVQRWGMMAPAVLARWNIRQTIDLGNMVYLLIRNQLWQKTEGDSIEDFRDVFDLPEALKIEADFELKE
jgi:uncharacterized repeat protein (TIGR04138 family)